MSENLLIQLSVTILFLPLLGFFAVIFLNKKIPNMYKFELGVISLTFIATLLVLYGKLSGYIDETIIGTLNWIDFGKVPVLGSVTIELGVKLDNVAVIMLFTVNLISMLVHYYSVAYMKDDIRYNLYFAYLGIFTFSMLGIVITHNLLMMYIFWELVGLSSYLLIGFWFEKDSAADAGKKAFLVNRVGDIGMFIGILILYTNYHTFTFDEIFAQIQNGVIPFGSSGWLTAAGILVFMGAVGKSAQFPLHVWLPDAMEGPTPVSALIHAATMVAAGVYLVARIFAMLTADAMVFIAVVGAITSFVAATIAITQNDIKKVLAYSTVSQLGYMVMSLGVGAYAFAFFHLVTHAFFKACLFLGSGSVIQAMHHEQDIREMGGLRKKLPITYVTFLISTLAISGIPLTSGFLSKDGILAGTLAFGDLTGHWLIPAIGFTVALLTAFYMFRLVILTFHGKPRNKEKYDHAHESPKLMTVPLIVLSTLSIFIFYTPNPLSPDAGWFLDEWISTPQTVVPQSSAFEFMNDGTTGTSNEIIHSQIYEDAMHHAHYPAMFLSLALAGLGIFLAFVFYQWKKISADKFAESIKPIYQFSLNKWYVDEIYHYTVISGTLAFSKILHWFDAYIVDGIVNGSAALTRLISRISGLIDTYIVDGLVNFTALFSGFMGLSLRRLQTGKVQTYIVFVIFSVFVLLWVFNSI
ncbi:MAG: NADH-quinone oxidoreductase subunit L [Melioribacteraceae bacterium]|nr:NADH-quinone oxidoreductase subunit L [Melioribacteraceae bacterium]